MPALSGVRKSFFAGLIQFQTIKTGLYIRPGTKAPAAGAFFPKSG